MIKIHNEICKRTSIINSKVVKDFLQRKGLNLKTRKREAFNYKCVFSKILRDRGKTLIDISKTIDFCDHSTTIHRLKMYDILTENRDEQFLKNKREVENYIILN